MSRYTRRRDQFRRAERLPHVSIDFQALVVSFILLGGQRLFRFWNVFLVPAGLNSSWTHADASSVFLVAARIATNAWPVAPTTADQPAGRIARTKESLLDSFDIVSICSSYISNSSFFLSQR